MKKILKNKYLKRSLIMALVLIVFCLLRLISVDKSKKQLMNNLDYDIVLNKDGSMKIIETWDINISHANTLFRTFEKNNKFGNITDVTVKDLQTGNEFKKINEYMYNVTDDCYYALDTNTTHFEIAWGTGMEHKSGNKKYQISYTVTNVIKDYKDCQELYWKLLNEENAIPVKKVTGKIKLPQNVKNIDNLKVWGHGPLNGTINPISKNTVEFEVKNLSALKMLEVRTVVTDKMFDVDSSKKYNYKFLSNIVNEETQNAEKSNNSTSGFYVFLGFISLIACIFNIKNIIKYKKISKKKDDGIIHNNLKYFRDIPRKESSTPAEATYLYYFKNDFDEISSKQSDMFSATILDLNLKGYIETRIDGDKIYIKVLNKKIDLPEDEANVYKLLMKVSSEGEFEIDELNDFAKKNYYEYSDVINELINSSRENLYNLKLLDKANLKLYTKSKNAKTKLNIILWILNLLSVAFVIGFIPFVDRTYIVTFNIGHRLGFLINMLVLSPLISVLILKQYFASKMQNKISILTQSGTEEQEQWQGLARYMEDYSLINEKEIQSIILWEKYLVFATAFGVADKVINQMKVKFPEVFVKEYWNEEQNNSDYPIMKIATHNFVYNIGNTSTISKISSCANKAYSTSLSEIAIHSSSRGSGRGGGFSGGGGGRWRRWPEWEQDK